MPNITRILAPVDFSAGSRAALDQALMFAEQFNAQLDVLHVWDVPQTVRPDLLVWSEGAERQAVSAVLAEQANTEMQNFLKELPAALRQRMNLRTERGDTVKTILRLVESEGYDLVVMGTHGRTGLAHALLGSVAERVVRQAHCPVLTVRMRAGDAS